MALQVFTQPHDYNPIHNPIMLEAVSNNTANVDFKYKVTIQIPGALDRTLFVSPRPVDSRLELDLATHLRDYMEYDDFIAPTGFNFTRAPFVQFAIEIRENWEGDDQDTLITLEGFVATNVLMTRQEELREKAGQYNRFHCKQDGIGVTNEEVLLHKPLGAPMYRDEYYYIHVVGIPQRFYTTARIAQYDKNGNPFVTANPTFLFPAGVSTQSSPAKYFKLDLSAIPFDPPCERIGITFLDGNGNPMTTEKVFDLRTYECTPWERWKLWYMDKLGSYNCMTLDMISSHKFEVMPKTFRKRIDPLTDTARNRGVTRYHQKSERKYVLNSDILNEAQAEMIKDLISSPRVYRDVRGLDIDDWGTGETAGDGSFIPIEVLTNKIEMYDYGANNLPQYPIEVRYSYPETIRHE